jgi:drug/metabolite transporter (DMT)-like permease
MTILLIIVQSFYGICVGYAYKYADVLIKNLSTSTTLALLVFISYGVFGAPLTFYSVAGVVIIIVTSYLYLRRELN